MMRSSKEQQADSTFFRAIIALYGWLNSIVELQYLEKELLENEI